ncbi:MAG TPA: hypothetical protein VMQ62_15665 [Dongiaceae bacterium]|nr:hypothetical protein [Dongiaceae bacterium]
MPWTRRRIGAALVISLAVARAAPGSDRMAELWSDPRNIATRDLYYGAGGRPLAPRADVAYEVVGLDRTGHSHGYDVVGPDGRKWAVKVGEEAQSDLVVSRILWAIGYHQPITYYVPRWRIAGASEAPPPGRFRLSSDHKVTGEWSWNDNPFVDTRPYRGLIVANLILNNWDFTRSNNRTYQVETPGTGPETWYVVQDVGGSLGKTRWPVGTRNNVDEFVSERLIREVDDGSVRFTYKSRHRGLVSDIPPDDVVWICRLMDRLSPAQLDDAFRAAGYPAGTRERYVRKIRQKIQEGLALEQVAERRNR